MLVVMPEQHRSRSAARVARDRLARGSRRARDTLAIIGSKDGADLLALEHAVVDADAGPAGKRTSAEPAGGGDEAGVGVLGVDAALDRVAARASTSSWAKRSGSPAAIRSCSATMSMPVTSSVTGCSTCSRVFISRK